jgi:small nuclear ribonucleoprotein B and B'
MLSLVNWRLKITLNDGRALTGQMLAFDKHMNLVLADCEEFRRVKSKKSDQGGVEQELKRTLGLIILRGETVVSISVEGPPPAGDDDKSKSSVCTMIGTTLFYSRFLCFSCRLDLDAVCPLVVEWE